MGVAGVTPLDSTQLPRKSVVIQRVGLVGDEPVTRKPLGRVVFDVDCEVWIVKSRIAISKGE